MKLTITRSLILIMTLLAAHLAVAAGHDSELAAFKNAIRAKYDMKEKAFVDHDPDTIVDKFYSKDVISTGEGENLTIGREALRPLYKEVTQTHPGRVKIESFDTKVSGDLGWDWAHFHVMPDDPNTKPFTFTILFLWQKRHGEWWCAGDIYVVDHSNDQKKAE